MHSSTVADLHSKILDARPPRSKFFQFHAVFGKIWQNRMLTPPWRFGAPPRGNPGSATAVGCVPSAAVVVSPATYAPPATHAPHHTCPLPCPSPTMHAATLWTEFLTHACENITFPQLLLRTVINTTIKIIVLQYVKLSANLTVFPPQTFL